MTIGKTKTDRQQNAIKCINQEHVAETFIAQRRRGAEKNKKTLRLSVSARDF